MSVAGKDGILHLADRLNDGRLNDGMDARPTNSARSATLSRTDIEQSAIGREHQEVL
jgi:hypothetical protein